MSQLLPHLISALFGGLQAALSWWTARSRAEGAGAAVLIPARAGNTSSTYGALSILTLQATFTPPSATPLQAMVTPTATATRSVS